MPTSIPAPAEADELPRGATLGRYVILKRLGRGAMGVVYLAFDGDLDRRVAIKVLRPEASADASMGETRSRLLREAQAMAKVAHPHVVSVYDVGTVDEEVFVAMEYVPGATLREWRDKTRPRPRAIVDMYVQAGRGLSAAHAAGILHRDFKPENVLVDAQGHAKVLDFGLARLEALAGETPESLAKIELHDTGIDHRPGLATPLTHFGAILGTPAYMAPEQLVGETATARSDQFAFCVALYEAIHGELPFEGTTLTSLAASIHAGRLRPVRPGVKCPRGVRRVLLHGMTAAPERRFASMGQLLDALVRAVGAPSRRIAIGGSALAAAAAVTLLVLRPAPTRLCRGAEEVLAPAWSTAREEAVRAAFARLPNARAEETFFHARDVIDRYARSWLAMRTDACEATRVRGEQSEAAMDLRMACLAQRERELKATVDLLATPDDRTIDKAVEAAAQLTPVESCADVDALRAPFSPPRDEAQRTGVEQVRRQVAELQAGYTVGRIEVEAAIAGATSLVDQAGRLGYEPVRAEALKLQGDIERVGEKPERAIDTLFRAAIVAERVRHDAVAAGSWMELAGVQGADLGHFEDADRTIQLAIAAVQRSGSEALRGDLLCTQADIAYRRGATTEMRSYAEQCIGLRERVLGVTHPDTLNARQSLADALWDSGEVEASLPVYRQILEARTALLGPMHPGTTRSVSDVGVITYELGDYAGALPILEQATKNPALPAAHVYYLTYMAEALVGAGRIDEGIAIWTDAHARMLEMHGKAGEDVRDLAADFSRILAQRELDARAEVYANEALEIAKTYSRDQEKGEALGARALVEARRGDAATAIADASEALAVRQKLLGERAEIMPRLALGLAYLGSHREADALADLERALQLGERYRGDLAIRAEVRFAAARAIVATKGDAARARALATRAAGELESVGLAESGKRVRQWLAANQ